MTPTQRRALIRLEAVTDSLPSGSGNKGILLDAVALIKSQNIILEQTSQALRSIEEKVEKIISGTH